jgi:hypothetical protein
MSDFATIYTVGLPLIAFIAFIALGPKKVFGKSSGHRDINRSYFFTIRGFILKPLPDCYLQRWFGTQQKVTGTKSPFCSGHNPEGSPSSPD